MELPSGCVSIEGPGDPIYRDGPEAGVVAAIKILVRVAADGRTYYRTGPNEGWRRLLDVPSFDNLNRATDAYRQMSGRAAPN